MYSSGFYFFFSPRIIIFSKPSRDTISEYMRRVDFLKGVIGTSKLTNATDRVAAAQMLPRNAGVTADLRGPSITTQIHQKTNAKYTLELRSELFNLDGGTDDYWLEKFQT